MKEKVYSIIPARKNSKRIKFKNNKLFHNKPLVEWSIIASKKSKYIYKTIVSTDDRNIKKISKKYKIDIPKLRPKKISSDNAKMIDVIKQSIKEHNMKDDDIIILLQPTSPLRNHNDIDKSLKKFKKTKANSLISVEKIARQYSPEKIFKKKKNFLSSYTSNQAFSSNLSKLNNYYAKNGPAILITYCSAIKKNVLYSKPMTFYEMKPQNSIDINYLWEFYIAEYIMKKKI